MKLLYCSLEYQFIQFEGDGKSGSAVRINFKNDEKIFGWFDVIVYCRNKLIWDGRYSAHLHGAVDANVAELIALRAYLSPYDYSEGARPIPSYLK